MSMLCAQKQSTAHLPSELRKFCKSFARGVMESPACLLLTTVFCCSATLPSMPCTHRTDFRLHTLQKAHKEPVRLHAPDADPTNLLAACLTNMHALSSEQFQYDKQCSSYYGAAQHDSLVLLLLMFLTSASCMSERSSQVHRVLLRA